MNKKLWEAIREDSSTGGSPLLDELAGILAWYNIESLEALENALIFCDQHGHLEMVQASKDD